jgi:hypothetical protein
LSHETSDGKVETAPASKTTATFYEEVLSTLSELGIEAYVHPMPSEIPDAIPMDVGWSCADGFISVPHPA